MNNVAAIGIGAVITTLLALSIHLILWPNQKTLPPPAISAIAIAIHGIGFSLAALLAGDYWMLAAFWFTVGPAGAVICVAWWVRKQRDHQATVDRALGALQGGSRGPERPDPRRN